MPSSSSDGVHETKARASAHLLPESYILAARVPESLKPQNFGLWTIERKSVGDLNPHGVPTILAFLQIGFNRYTLLRRVTWASVHLAGAGEVVMEDSLRELRRHLPIWLRARGRVLVTGLGLGCVVRGLLSSKHVEKITVVEIDKSILRVIGHEFESNHRVELIHGDAFKVQFGRRKFDYAWHDLWCEGEGVELHAMHIKLLYQFHGICEYQGAWTLPRFVKRNITEVKLIG